MREALGGIARRPGPDITGAIQHAMAALETTAREVTGHPNPTSGKLVSELDIPEPREVRRCDFTRRTSILSAASLSASFVAGMWELGELIRLGVVTAVEGIETEAELEVCIPAPLEGVL